MTEINNVKLIRKLKDKVNDYLIEKYKNVEIISFNKENRNEYLTELDKRLIDTNELLYVNFILPDGKMKRLEFDLSELKLNDIYKSFFNINNETLKDKFIIDHNLVKYLGFDVEDMLLAGCVRIGYNKINNECYLSYDQNYFELSKDILDVIEEILYDIDKIYFSNNDDEYQIFSYKNGDTIKDIKRFLKEQRKLLP